MVRLLMHPVPEQVRSIHPFCDRVEQEQHANFLHDGLLLANELARLAILRDPSNLALLDLRQI